MTARREDRGVQVEALMCRGCGQRWGYHARWCPTDLVTLTDGGAR